MSLLTTIVGWFGRRSAPLPDAPVIPSGTRRIKLKPGDLRWDSLEKIRAVTGARGSGYIIDLQGAVLDGSGLKHPADPQDEGASGIELEVNGVTLQNGWVYDIPGGIKCFGERCRFMHLRFLKAGEDFLSTVGRETSGILISSCEFWNAKGGDKSIQLNQAHGAMLRDCLVVGGTTGVRVQKVSYGTSQVVVMASGMRFVEMPTAWNVDGGAVVRTSGTKYEGVGKKVVIGTKVGGKVVES